MVATGSRRGGFSVKEGERPTAKGGGCGIGNEGGKRGDGDAHRRWSKGKKERHGRCKREGKMTGRTGKKLKRKDMRLRRGSQTGTNTNKPDASAKEGLKEGRCKAKKRSLGGNPSRYHYYLRKGGRLRGLRKGREGKGTVLATSFRT